MTIRRYGVVLMMVAAGCSSTKPAEPPAPAAAPTPVTPEPPAPTPVPQPEPVASPAPTPPPPPPPEPMREVFPSVRLDRAKHAVEIDGSIAQDGRIGPGEVTYLEVLACRPNSREHESIVITKAMASHVHAALLLAGGVPGSPGSWKWNADTKTLSPIKPTGARVAVTLTWTENGTTITRPIAEMVRNMKNKGSLSATPGHFLFAGSGFLKRRDTQQYAGDVSGTVIGLCTFGDEPIAWSEVFSPEETIDDPEWIVNRDQTPRAQTPVVLRIEVLEPAPTPTPAPAPNPTPNLPTR